jgi:hypothetical protein
LLNSTYFAAFVNILRKCEGSNRSGHDIGSQLQDKKDQHTTTGDLILPQFTQAIAIAKTRYDA